jgi:hypothetical protein
LTQPNGSRGDRQAARHNKDEEKQICNGRHGVTGTRGFLC